VEPKEAIEKLSAVDVKAVRDVARELYQPGRISVSAAGPEMNEGMLRSVAVPLSGG